MFRQVKTRLVSELWCPLPAVSWVTDFYGHICDLNCKFKWLSFATVLKIHKSANKKDCCSCECGKNIRTGWMLLVRQWALNIFSAPLTADTD